MLKPVTIIYAMILFLALHAPSYGQTNELTIVYTANSDGKLRDCNCPNDPYGGLAERTTLIKDLRKKEKPFLLVDAGNMVNLYGDYYLKASCVARMMNLMSYDAAAAGSHEMFRGITPALAISRAAKFPILSASIARKTNQNLVFMPYITKKILGITVAITAVCDSSCFIQGNSQEYDYIVIPAHDILRRMFADIAGKCDFIVVLSQMAPDSNIEILREYPDVDIIVEGYGNKTYDPPVNTPDGVIVSPGFGGQFVGLITIEKSNGTVTIKRSELIPVLDVPEDNKAHKIAVEYYRKRK